MTVDLNVPQTALFMSSKIKLMNIYVSLYGALKQLLYAGIFCLSVGCMHRAEIDSHDKPYMEWSDIRSGDLLFRMGNSASSNVVVTIGGGRYSHIGIAIVDSSGIRVVHSVPGEAGVEDDGLDKVRCDAIDLFYSPDRASAGAVARVACSDSIAELVSASAYADYESSVPFDHKYDLADSTSLYCTELIWRAYRKYGIDLADDRRQELVIPGHVLRIIFPEDIWNSRHLTVLHEFVR